MVREQAAETGHGALRAYVAMYEIILNSVKLALSKDARESAKGLLHLFKRSPEWQNDICTINACISIGDRERAIFLEELITNKLASLGFPNDACVAYQTCFHELSANAFEHAAAARRPVWIVSDTTPTYASVTVRNPRNVPVALQQWMAMARSRFESDPTGARGRGLLLVSSLADSFAEDDSNGLKAVVYRQRVRIETCVSGDVTLLAVVDGETNPSLARRLLDILREIKTDAIIALDRHSLPDYLFPAEVIGPIKSPTTSVGPIIPYVMMKRNQGMHWRMIVGNPALRALLPQTAIADEQDVRQFMDKLREIMRRH